MSVHRWILACTVVLTACGSTESEGAVTTSAYTALAIAAIDEAVCNQRVVQVFDFDFDPDLKRAEATRLEPMLGQVLAYGSERPTEFSGYRLEWIDPHDASVVITMVDDADRHRRALQDIVEFPDELIVCTGELSGEAAQQLLADLEPELKGRAFSRGKNTAGQVEIGLFADEQAFAQDLMIRFGNRIRLQVGAFPYPMPDPPGSTRCPSIDDAVERGDLAITVPPPGHPLTRAGGDVRNIGLDITVTNISGHLIEFSSGVATGYLVDQTGRVVADSGQLVIPAVDEIIRIGPGESTTLAMVASTSSCDPGIGYVVPAGSYTLIALVDEGINRQLRSAPLAVEVT